MQAIIWYDWSAAKMSAISTINCIWQLSTFAAYQDTSMLVSSTSGASITFPVNYTTSNSGDGHFFMPFLNLDSTHSSEDILNIPTVGFSKGLYILKLSNISNIFTHKVIVN
jgi:hypothetical protein